MIRRFYLVTLKPDVEDEAVNKVLGDFSATDLFVPGLARSSAGLDADNRTIVWEMTFVDEALYSGPYMKHPYHAATLDNYLLADSPENVAQATTTVRYEAEDIPLMSEGIRRIVLISLPEGSDTSAIEASAGRGDGMATSLFSPDNVGFRYGGSRTVWSHVWEQGFADMTQLDHYLQTPEAAATASTQGLRSLGIEADAVRTLTCPFQIKQSQSPPDVAFEGAPVLYTITARTALENADTYVALLETLYDPTLAESGVRLAYRRRSVDRGYGEVEVQSAWALESIGAYDALRMAKVMHPNWRRFITEAMPLLMGGTRRFYRA